MGKFVIENVYRKNWAVTEAAEGKAGSLFFELFDILEIVFRHSVLDENFNVINDEEIIRTLNRGDEIIEEYLDAEDDVEEEEPDTEDDEFNESEFEHEDYNYQPPQKKSRTEQLIAEETVEFVTHNDEEIEDRDEPIQDDVMEEEADADADIFPPIVLAEGETLAVEIYNRYTPFLNKLVQNMVRDAAGDASSLVILKRFFDGTSLALTSAQSDEFSQQEMDVVALLPPIGNYFKKFIICTYTPPSLVKFHSSIFL